MSVRDGHKPAQSAGHIKKPGRDEHSRPKRQETIKIVIDPDRMAAYKALLRIDKSKAYSNIELNAILSEMQDVVNPAFVRELVYGVIKNKRYLDYFIDALARDGIEGVRREIAILLRMGMYQIVFMDSVPDHSAVDETVKITKLLFPGRDGFVNGLLRTFIRKRESYYSKPEHEAFLYTITDATPSFEIERWNRKIPIPEIGDPVRRLSVMYSCDEGLVELLASQYGLEAAERNLVVSLETPPLFIRVNTIKTSSSDLAASLRSQGFKAEEYYSMVYDPEPGHADSLMVSGHGILETKEFRDGLFFVQDASSTEAVKALSPKADEILIDVCAAPGGKSFSAAIEMEDRGVIHDMDLHANKLGALEKQAKRLGISCIDIEEHDAKTVNEKYISAADKVICDVPCSGLGVLRRKPEIKDRPLANDGRDLAEIQYRILSASAEYVKPGGKLMYCTCTINKIENKEVTDRFLGEHVEFSKCCSQMTMPCSGGQDGFYYCIMQRTKN